jgi:hypothetical protein
MSEKAENTCTETGRTFPTAEAARASEVRFREIQSQCDSGLAPELRAGDVIYLDTELYISHGRDDFRGGLAEVVEVKLDKIGGTPVVFVRAAQEPDTWHNWTTFLASMQKTLREEFGKNWARPDPDWRQEFNEW